MRGKALGGLIIPLLMLAAGCGETAPAGSGSTPTSSDALACPLDRVDGCSVFGLVLKQPVPLQDALSVAAGYGTAIAVYPADWACTLSVSMAPPGAVPETREPTRFAYVDAAGIRERRQAAVGSGLAPPITGIHISQSYWDHWEDQWRLAQQPGVAVAAVAVYLTQTSRQSAAVDPTIGAVVEIPSRRTDSQDPSYPGELLLQDEAFPTGYLPETAQPNCG